jgi:3-oxoacyl-[acyl-carrier protein] reductase
MSLLEEGANVIINSRSEDKLKAIKTQYATQVEIVQGDITTDATISKLIRVLDGRFVSGVVFNAGGPPAMTFNETELLDWDKAYASLFRWKIKLMKELVDVLTPQKYGRILFIESASVKQPIPNLILSTSLRLAVVGFAKTLSQELAKDGINLNILAPGYHDTDAMQRLFLKRAESMNVDLAEARRTFEQEILSGKMGDPSDFAKVALFLLSESSKYITGQTISVDGGLIKGLMG